MIVAARGTHFDPAVVKERRLPSRRNFPGLGGLETALPCGSSVVIEHAMDPDSAHFAHGAVGKNSRVLDRNVSLIIEAIGHPAAQCFRRKPAFIHCDVEWMFVVVRARANGAQIFHESVAVPKLRGHKTISTNHLIMSF